MMQIIMDGVLRAHGSVLLWGAAMENEFDDNTPFFIPDREALCHAMGKTSTDIFKYPIEFKYLISAMNEMLDDSNIADSTKLLAIMERANEMSINDMVFDLVSRGILDMGHDGEDFVFTVPKES